MNEAISLKVPLDLLNKKVTTTYFMWLLMHSFWLTGNAQHQVLVSKDQVIERQNKRLKKTHDSKVNADARLASLQIRASDAAALAKASKSKSRADDAYAKAQAASLQTVGTGSGKVAILLPSVLPTDILSRRTSSYGRGLM